MVNTIRDGIRFTQNGSGLFVMDDSGLTQRTKSGILVSGNVSDEDIWNANYRASPFTEKVGMRVRRTTQPLFDEVRAGLAMNAETIKSLGEVGRDALATVKGHYQGTVQKLEEMVNGGDFSGALRVVGAEAVYPIAAVVIGGLMLIPSLAQAQDHVPSAGDIGGSRGAGEGTATTGILPPTPSVGGQQVDIGGHQELITPSGKCTKHYEGRGICLSGASEIESYATCAEGIEDLCSPCCDSGSVRVTLSITIENAERNKIKLENKLPQSEIDAQTAFDLFTELLSSQGINYSKLKQEERGSYAVSFVTGNYSKLESAGVNFDILYRLLRIKPVERPTPAAPPVVAVATTPGSNVGTDGQPLPAGTPELPAIPEGTETLVSGLEGVLSIVREGITRYRLSGRGERPYEYGVADLGRGTFQVYKRENGLAVGEPITAQGGHPLERVLGYARAQAAVAKPATPTPIVVAEAEVPVAGPDLGLSLPKGIEAEAPGVPTAAPMPTPTPGEPTARAVSAASDGTITYQASDGTILYHQSTLAPLPSERRLAHIIYLGPAVTLHYGSTEVVPELTVQELAALSGGNVGYARIFNLTDRHNLLAGVNLSLVDGEYSLPFAQPPRDLGNGRTGHFSGQSDFSRFLGGAAIDVMYVNDGGWGVGVRAGWSPERIGRGESNLTEMRDAQGDPIAEQPGNIPLSYSPLEHRFNGGIVGMLNFGEGKLILVPGLTVDTQGRPTFYLGVGTGIMQEINGE